MAAPKTPAAGAKPRTAGEKLRAAADQLYALAERWDCSGRSLLQLQMLHDETEAVAGDVRAVVRGRGFH